MFVYFYLRADVFGLSGVGDPTNSMGLLKKLRFKQIPALKQIFPFTKFSTQTEHFSFQNKDHWNVLYRSYCPLYGMISL